MRKYLFPAIIGITALVLACVAGFFSITGMANIFPGWSTIVMTSAIEAGKLVSVSVLYRMWKRLSWLKWLLVPMTAIIMLITSIGVFGHLSSKYEGTASGMRTHESQVKLEGQRVAGIREKIAACDKAIARKQVRSASLVDLRTKQENRLDSLYARSQLRAAKEVQASIAHADKEIAVLNAESDSLTGVIDDAMVEIAALDSAVIRMESNASGGEAGTIKFISRAMNRSTDSVANVFMLLIISVFDPLSIILLIVFNMAIDRADGPKEEEIENVEEPVEELPEKGPEKDVDEPIEVKPKGPEKGPEKDVEEPIEVKPQEPEMLAFSKEPESQEIHEPSAPVVKVPEIVPPITSKKELYAALLYVLYQNGKLNENDHLDTYHELVDKISASNILCTKEQIDEFLEACVDLDIIKIGKHERVALKSYVDALAAIGEVSK